MHNSVRLALTIHKWWRTKLQKLSDDVGFTVTEFFRKLRSMAENICTVTYFSPCRDGAIDEVCVQCDESFTHETLRGSPGLSR